MKPAPQQVEEDVFVGSCQTPPPELEVPSRRNGLLEDLVILGYVPVPEAVVWVSFIKTDDTNYQKG